MPTPRQEIAIAMHNGNIYVFGGLGSNGSTLTTAERYDPAADTWETIAPLPVPLNHAAAATAGGKIYVVGGSQTFPLEPESFVFEYDPKVGFWTSRSQMPFVRAAMAAVTVDEKLYVVGGVGQLPASVLEYSPSLDQWQVKSADMPTLREHHAAAVSNGMIYVFSGRWEGQNVAAVEAYDPLNDIWLSRASIPTERSGLAACAVNDTIYVLGGELPEVFATNERYLVASDVWERSEPMPTARHGLGAVQVSRRIYSIGGGLVAGLRPTGVVEVFTP
ncbi:MAG: kelch repeat-containing protein [Bacteroidota bacterium]